MSQCGVDCGSCGLHGLRAAEDQPPDDREYFLADGVFIKQMYIKNTGTIIPQHSHRYDHTSMLATGSVRVWADGALVGDRVAPVGIFIKAGVKHMFQSLQDETIIYCVHRLHDTDEVEVFEPHQIVEAA